MCGDGDEDWEIDGQFDGGRHLAGGGLPCVGTSLKRGPIRSQRAPSGDQRLAEGRCDKETRRRPRAAIDGPRALLLTDRRRTLTESTAQLLPSVEECAPDDEYLYRWPRPVDDVVCLRRPSPSHPPTVSASYGQAR